jgi:hypothetical protein
MFTEKSSPEFIIEKIKKGEWTYVINGLCNIKDNLIIFDYNYFKLFATKETYEIILTHVFNCLNNIISIYDTFVVHINMKNITISDIDKHLNFIKYASTLMQDKYPNKLTKCYIYNAPIIFSKILNMLSFFIDKETQTKIEIVQRK